MAERINLKLIREDHHLLTRKTKIICTLGPSCWSVEGLGALLDAGMNVARFNFSHGDHETHGACLERLREAVVARPGTQCAVMLDTKGPEIRTGQVDPSCGSKLVLEKGNTIEVGTDYDKKCTPAYLACSYKSLPTSVQVGSKILVADGSLTLQVTEIKATSVMATILNNCSLGDRKNMNLPGCIVDLPTLTDKDKNDLVHFGVANGVDFIAASFVRKGSDIDNIRQCLGSDGKHIQIIAKIENQEGLENYDAILEKTDGIMVARGDLGMEIPIEKVFLAQKMMIRKANIAGRPVVTATQMLESMITNPRPTRAECADVANAVLDGTDCVMLSGETANGEYSVAAVQMMANISLEAESMIDYNQQYMSIRNAVLEKEGHMGSVESITSSAVKTAYDVDAKLIIVLSESGTSARMIAKYHPAMPILVLTPYPEVARQCQGYIRNCRSTVVGSMIGTDQVLLSALDSCKRLGLGKSKDRVVCVHGAQEAKAGSTNMLRVLEMP